MLVNPIEAYIIYAPYNFQLVMSLLAMSLGLRFCGEYAPVKKVAGQAEVGRFQH